MKQKTKKPTTITVSAASHDPATYNELTHDLKNSILVVSVLVNLFILTTWVTLQVTSQYDTQLSSWLFTR